MAVNEILEITLPELATNAAFAGNGSEVLPEERVIDVAWMDTAM